MTISEAIYKIKSYVKTQKRLPTSYEEYRQAFGFSSRASSFELVNKMIAAGIVSKDDRGKLIPKKLFSIPHFGIIKAGTPIPADTTPDESFDMYHILVSLPADTFSLTIKGDSMKDAMIAEGDIAILDKNKLPKDGDIVAALVDGECTLKYLYKKDHVYILHPANAMYNDIPLTDTSMIQGVVIHILRTIK